MLELRERDGVSSAELEKRPAVVSAQFVTSVFGSDALPLPELPEVAFVGRSNAGKSSLLNALCRYRHLARVSKTPGRTEALNFFEVRLRDPGCEPSTRRAYFVDLPGFGYAAVRRESRKWWDETIGSYLCERETLCLIILVLDVRRDVEEEEQWVLELRPSDRILPVVTKCDRLTRGELDRRLGALSEQFGSFGNRVVAVSAVDRRLLERSGLEASIVAACREEHLRRRGI